MKCPACFSENTRVLDSRVSDQENTIRRRRECVKCGFRFSTCEEMEILDLSVIKRDGRHEPYSREKIELGLVRSLEKRPVSTQEFRSLLADIERDIYVHKQPEVKTSDIGEIVMIHLKKLDKVAYIRFASVYRAFEDVDNFKQEIENLNKNLKKRSKKNNPYKQLNSKSKKNNSIKKKNGFKKSK
jgi:transcriptional repressor NrdR